MHVIWNLLRAELSSQEEYYMLFSKSGFSEDLNELAKEESNILLKELL